MCPETGFDRIPQHVFNPVVPAGHVALVVEGIERALVFPSKRK